MPTISTLTAVLNLDQSGFRSGVEDAQNDLDGLQGQAQKTGKKLTSAGKTMTAGITAPLMAMGALSARTAASFDQNMQKSIAVMGDVDEAMREDLEQTAQEVANTTTHSADQAAQSYYYLASAGLDAQESMAAMPQVAAFAEAGQMDMAQATDTATNVMSAFGYEADEMTEVTDTLTATVSNHNQTMQDMSSAMSKVAPVASSLGFSIEETSAAIGQMGDVGIQGERAGTALRNVMSQISDEGSTVTKKLEGMGVATRDSQGNILSLTQVLANMEEAGVGAGDAASVFGTEAGPAMAALMQEGSSALQENTDRLREAEGATKDMATTQRETLNAELSIAKSNLKDVGIAIGSQLLPMLSSLTRYVKGASERFQGLSDGQQKAIIAAVGLLAALGPVLMMAGLMAQSIVALSGAYGVLTASSWGLSGALSGGVVPSAIAANVALGPITVPIWAIIAAIGVLVAAVAGLYYAFTNNMFGIKDKTYSALSTVKGWFDAAPDWILALLGPVGWLYKGWSENLFGIQDITGQVFDWIGNKIDWLMKYIEKIPGIGGDGDGGPSIESPDEPDPPDSEDFDNGELSQENFDPAEGEDGDWETEGENAGQEFGSGFQNGVVDNLQTGDIETHLEERLSELEERKSNVYGEEYTEAREEAQRVEEQLAQVRDAENLGEVETELVVDVARSELESEEERSTQLEDVRAQLKEEGFEIDTSSDSNGTSMSSEDIDKQSVEKMLAESSDEGGQESDLAAKFDTLLEKHDQLRTTVETLQLIVEMDLNSREFNKIIDERAEAKAKEIINGTGP
ncbi:phage tail tape measure protein [Natrinema sp. DC36]|uniref:phage tail tape measure protein n=1 Tax=Natrinema sp. DC36 TaxID=2878680 RepID=UPI001CEFC8A7|nr:phage tail tape measure protein [Natrinema sp. DC36]